VNLSAQSIARTDFSAWLRDALAQRGALAHKLVFEITETAAIAGYGIAQEFIREMRRFGCRFALDDFGSGYTSYAHLKNLRTDILKIDGSFVRDMIASESDAAMVKSMSDIAHVLGMKTVAEWVEQPEVLALLAEGGIDYAQGYAIERPFRLELLASRILTTNAASQDGIGQFDAVAGAAS
jgi:EAL domain-containing protein (putative c-di-GMP-specific phosphodiesterase class I)